jgi:hypothetical protein
MRLLRILTGAALAVFGLGLVLSGIVVGLDQPTAKGIGFLVLMALLGVAFVGSGAAIARDAQAATPGEVA